jgi:SsrA-binding protein
MAAKKDSSARAREVRNSKVFRDYFIDEKFEAGIVLTGTEVKSVRAGRVQLNDSFGRVEKQSIFLYHVHISEYEFGNINNHNPYRPRKLLLHRKEIEHIAFEVSAGGKAIIPTRMYFKGGLVKVELGLCRGKKLYDKRDDLKKKAHEEEMQRALKSMRR